MTTKGTIELQVDAALAQRFRTASEEEKRKIQALVSLLLGETSSSVERLQKLLDIINENAAQRGLTPDVLDSLLPRS